MLFRSTYTGLPKLTDQNSIMPVKCSFCRKRYERAGAYETHLPIAHADLDIILASIIRNLPTNIFNQREIALSNNNGPIQLPDSNYKPDPTGDPASNEHDSSYPMFMHKSDMEALDSEHSTSSVAAEQEDYPRTGEAIGEVRGYLEECSN